MEQQQNLPVIGKRVWSIVRVVFFMLRKGISKGKLMADLNTMLKRGKNLIFQPHHFGDHHRVSSSSAAAREYEFSCSNTPAFTFPFHAIGHKKKARLPRRNDAALTAVIEMLNNHNEGETITAPSPYLPGFGRTPAVRPLRITDSPFPLAEEPGLDNGHVDKAAEEFIRKFYNNLLQQKMSY